MIDKEWDFKHIVIHAKALKKIYKDTLASFSYFNKKDLVEYKRSIRNEVYSIKARVNQKDSIWNYFNDCGDMPSLYYYTKKTDRQ